MIEGSSARSRGLDTFSDLRSGYQPQPELSQQSATDAEPNNVLSESASSSSASATTASTSGINSSNLGIGIPFNLKKFLKFELQFWKLKYLVHLNHCLVSYISCN